jgi:heat shock protein HslJ
MAYALEATGPGGTSQAQQTINVVEAATATPEPTAAPEVPVIHAFSVSPNQVQAGECMGISWSVGGGTSYSRILRNGAVLIDDAGYSGQQMDCLYEPGTYTYRLEASNPTGESVSQEQVGIVTEGAPENPLAGTRWQATAIHDAETGSIAEVIPDTSLTASFGADGRLNGSAGCNTYSASYTVSGAQLAFTPPSLTSMLCEEDVMSQETVFVTALTQAGSYNVEGEQLYILNALGQTTLEFVTMP